MSAIGIIAEYNPFHTGHGHQIAATRAAVGDLPVVAVMSGCWVQQADCAIADKWTRARLALMGGADLILELPTPWAMSSAESFARGAVELLCATGVVDILSFGSECGQIAPLEQAAVCLNSEAYRRLLPDLSREGLPFPVCRQKAVEQLAGTECAALLSTPNNNLGVEYLRALHSLSAPIRPITIKRQGAGHGTLDQTGPYRSATQLREALRRGAYGEALPFLPAGANGLLDPLPDLGRLERALLLRLRTMTAEDWSRLPDSGAAEGLPNRLVEAGRSCTSAEEFFSLAKTRRYTHARLRRLALWALLGLEAQGIPSAPPYLRVLGFSPRGREVLREMKAAARLPVLTKPAHVRALSQPGQRIFALESRCTDLYYLTWPDPRPAGADWTTSPVTLSCQTRRL